MSRDDRVSQRAGAARPDAARRGAAGLPEPPEASFWLERTPLPTARRAGPGPSGRSALAPPGTVCPKCDSPLSPSEPACPSCGLKRAMFGRFRAGVDDRVPPALEALWSEVETHWSEPELHERFLAQVSLCGAYAYAAARYRRAARLRQSDAIARLQLERLSRMVHAVMAVSAVRPGSGASGAHPYRGLVAFLVILVGLGGFGSLYLFHKRGAPVDDRVPPSIKVRRGRSLSPDGRPAPAFGGLHAAGKPRTRAGARPADEADAAEPAEPAEQPEPADPADRAANQSGAEEE